MANLYILRHLKSQWNLENRFTGWTDVPLSKEGIERAGEISDKIPWNEINAVYSSPLIRNEATVVRIMSYYPDKYPIFIHLDKGKMKDWGNFKEEDNYLPVFISENLNERYYGDLQGLNKKETMEKHGEDQVHLWRRGFKDTPPGGESLKDTFKRAVPFYQKNIEKDLKEGKNVLIVASHNSLRAIIKYIENISDDDIVNKEVDYGGLLKYTFDESLQLKDVEKL